MVRVTEIAGRGHILVNFFPPADGLPCPGVVLPCPFPEIYCVCRVECFVLLVCAEAL